jgi:hypothetical protein
VSRPKKSAPSPFELLSPEEAAEVASIVAASGAPRALVEATYRHSMGRPASPGARAPGGREQHAAAALLMQIAATRAGTRTQEHEDNGTGFVIIRDPFAPCSKCGHVEESGPQDTLE